MSFADTYQAEVLQSRKIRAQRAFFWARIVGLALMFTIAATLRADPQLRSVLMQAGMNGVSQMANLRSDGPSEISSPRSAAPQNSALPTARIKINRPGDTPSAPQQQIDAQAIAAQLAAAMAAQKVGN